MSLLHDSFDIASANTPFATDAHQYFSHRPTQKDTDKFFSVGLLANSNKSVYVRVSLWLHNKSLNLSLWMREINQEADFISRGLEVVE